MKEDSESSFGVFFSVKYRLIPRELKAVQLFKIISLELEQKKFWSKSLSTDKRRD